MLVSTTEQQGGEEQARLTELLRTNARPHLGQLLMITVNAEAAPSVAKQMGWTPADLPRM